MSTTNKELEIQTALEEKNVWKLRELCLTDGGLLNDSFRRQAWPLILNVNDTKKKNTKVVRFEDDVKEKEEVEYDPIWERDVTRCTWHIKDVVDNTNNNNDNTNNNAAAATVLKENQRQVIELIQETLSHQKKKTKAEEEEEEELHYYQGYADMACIVWNIFHTTTTTTDNNNNDDSTSSSSSSMATSILSQISQRHLKTIMSETFVPLQTTLYWIWNPLLDFQSPTLYDLFHAHEEDSIAAQLSSTPTFCLSWILTWFSHDVKDTITAKRIFDACLASHALFPIYLSIALLHSHTSTLIGGTDDENNEEEASYYYDYDVLYPMLSQLPMKTTTSSTATTTNHSSWQSVIDTSLSLMERVPPYQLKALSKHYYKNTTTTTIVDEVNKQPTWDDTTLIPSWLQEEEPSSSSQQDDDEIPSQYSRTRIALGRRCNNNNNKQLLQHRTQMTIVSICMAYIFATEVLIVPTVVLWGMILNANNSNYTTMETTTIL